MVFVASWRLFPLLLFYLHTLSTCVYECVFIVVKKEIILCLFIRQVTKCLSICGRVPSWRRPLIVCIWGREWKSLNTQPPDQKLILHLILSFIISPFYLTSKMFQLWRICERAQSMFASIECKDEPPPRHLHLYSLHSCFCLLKFNSSSNLSTVHLFSACLVVWWQTHNRTTRLRLLTNRSIRSTSIAVNRQSVLCSLPPSHSDSPFTQLFTLPFVSILTCSFLLFSFHSVIFSRRSDEEVDCWCW